MPRKSWIDIYTALGVDRGTLLAWRRTPGSPGDSKDIGEWRLWMAERHQTAYAERGKKGLDLSKASSDQKRKIAEALPGKCSYDQAFLLGYPEQAAKLREQVIGEEIANRKAELDLQKLRGGLVEKEESEEAIIEMANHYNEAMKTCPESLLKITSKDKQRELKTSWKRAVAEIRSKVAESLKGTAGK